MAAALNETTGDLRNNLMKLTREIKRMKLNIELNLQGLSLGCPSSFLPILHASLMQNSLPLANWLTRQGYELYSKSDLRFIEGLYKVLRDVFHYHPKLTKEQFLSVGFAERKVILTTRVLLLSQTKHLQLTGREAGKKKSRRPISSSDGIDGVDQPVRVVVVDNRIDWTGDQPVHDTPSIALSYTPPPSPHRQAVQPLTPNSDLELTPHPTPLDTRSIRVTHSPITVHAPLDTRSTRVTPPPLTVHALLDTRSTRVTPPPLTVHAPLDTRSTRVTPPPLTVHALLDTRSTRVTPPPLTVHAPLDTRSTRVTPPPLTVHAPLGTRSTRVTPPPLTVHALLDTRSTRVTPPPRTVHATGVSAGISRDDSDMGSTEGVNARVNMTNGESERVNDETLDGVITLSEDQGFRQNSGNHGDIEPSLGLLNISNRIDDLARLVETMSARFVLVENQMKLVESNCHLPTQAHTHPPQPHITHPSQPSDSPPYITHSSQPSDSPPHVTHPLKPMSIGSEVEPGVTQPVDHMGRHELSTPHSTLRAPYTLPIHHSPTTPDEAKRLIATLRSRAKSTRDFLQLANSRHL